jgi:protein required for attachment to host cells
MTSHAPITQKTWVAVFDGGRAAVFENEGFDDAPNLRFVFGPSNDNPPTHEQGTDKPGRYPTPMGGRAAVENTDLHAQAEQRFVEALAKEVDAAAAGGRFDRLVVIAPSTLLPRFREHAPRASERIVAERAGDFVRAPTDTIERVFREAVSGRA